MSSISKANIDQTCYDGIGSKAVVTIEAALYKVELTGSIVQVLVEKSLVYSYQQAPSSGSFSAPMRFDSHGAKIQQSDLYLTYRASWDQSSLVINARGGAKGETQNWVLQYCVK